MTDNTQLLGRLEEVMRSGDFAGMADLASSNATADFAQEYPQSGERIPLKASIEMGKIYEKETGTRPAFTFRRMLSGDDLFVVEGTIDYGDGVPVSYCGVGELRDGKVAKMTEYFANPFPAPEWRASFAERMA